MAVGLLGPSVIYERPSVGLRRRFAFAVDPLG
jgi:hypothetical protein